MDRRSFLAVLVTAVATGVLAKTTLPARAMPAAGAGDAPTPDLGARSPDIGDAHAPDGTPVEPARRYWRRRRRVCWAYYDRWGRRRRRCRWVWRRW